MSNKYKKPQYKPKCFESKGIKYTDGNGTTRTDTSANIYESMLLSGAYQDLSTRQQQLYTLCKAQYYGKRKPGNEPFYRDNGYYQGNEYFYLNLDSVVKYGLYTRNMRSKFYADMKALEQHGFIKQVLKGGGNGHTKSIYQYSDGWRTWSKEQ